MKENLIEINNIRVGSFNVRGLTSNIRKEQLDEDFNNYRLGILCLQETKTTIDIDINQRFTRLILLKPECRHYGLGFVIRKDLDSNIETVKQINDRIAYIQLKLDDSRSLIIINVYAPHSKLTEKDPKIRIELYDTLDKLVKEKEKEGHGKNIILLAGDFNSKVGKNLGNIDQCLGQYSRGIRNENGQALVDFCNGNNLFITNSAFSHSARHQTTWSSTTTRNNETKTIYNMIDYIICPQRYKSMFTDSRSYSGTILTSDHRVVIGKISIKWYKTKTIKNKEDQNKEQRFNTNLLKKINKTHRKISKQYKKELNKKLNPILVEVDINAKDKWAKTKDAIIETATEVIGIAKSSNNEKQGSNNTIKELSQKQKEIRLKIQDKKTQIK